MPPNLEECVPWIQPAYSRAEVNRAGKTLVESSDQRQVADARIVLSNWRSAHGYPLNALAMTLKNRASSIPVSLIAQRLKRLVSIENKLLRRSHQRATQIQDIGGARIIVPTMTEVQELSRKYEQGRSSVFELHRTDDYIATPKTSGYRSLHLVYRYASDKRNEWRNMRIELQVRTDIQHAWAAAVEAASFFRREDLKGGEGDPQWLRLFVLMGQWMAEDENCPGIQNMRANYLDELHDLWNQLNADTLLTGWAMSVNTMLAAVAELRDSWRFLLHLNVQERTITATSFKKAEEAVAALNYEALETRHADDPDHHIVLVTVPEVRQLTTAYPGFFADTTKFRESARRALRVARRGGLSRPRGI